VLEVLRVFIGWYGKVRHWVSSSIGKKAISWFLAEEGSAPGAITVSFSALLERSVALFDPVEAPGTMRVFVGSYGTVGHWVLDQKQDRVSL